MISGQRLVRASIGPFECSEHVRHTLTSKIVRKRLIGWKDYKVLHVTTDFDTYWPLQPFDHSIEDAGTFHVYVEDVAETIDGFRQRLVKADGPAFVCENSVCRLP
jgi:hypothetical protein